MDTENNGWFKLESIAPLHNKENRSGTNEFLPPTLPQTVSAPRKEAPQMQPVPAAEGLQHSLTVGSRGPVLMQDTVLHETMANFANAPFPRRVVHTKGFGAFGFFRPAADMQAYTAAALFHNPLTQTQTVARFSLAASDGSTPDTARNIRGLAVKFYTDEGVYDLLCDSLPVFFVRDAIKVPKTIAALGPSPVNNLPDPNQVWGMFAQTPEATNLLTWFFSDMGTAKSFRTIRYYSVNTYVWINAQGVRHYVKYCWIPAAGEAYIDQKEAARLACENPNIAGQDLYETIASLTPVEFDLYVQLMDPDDAVLLPYDPLDDTKFWDENAYPLLHAGRLTLNRNPEDYSEQVEKLAFAPANLVKGIALSDDKMLQGRAIVYSDAQRHRLGNAFRKIPVNRQANWSPDSMTDSGVGTWAEGAIGRNPIPKQDDFTQAGQHYDAMSANEQQNLIENMAGDLSAASATIKETILGYLEQASPTLSARVRQALK